MRAWPRSVTRLPSRVAVRKRTRALTAGQIRRHFVSAEKMRLAQRVDLVATGMATLDGVITAGCR
jgi:hypothetical protein